MRKRTMRMLAMMVFAVMFFGLHAAGAAEEPKNEAAKAPDVNITDEAPVEVKGPVPWISSILGASDKTMIKQDDTDWFEATVNSPIGEGDMVWQDAGAKSEIFIARKTYLRLADSTGVVFDKLTDDEVRVVATRGTLEAGNGMDIDLLVDVPGQTVIVPKGSAARIEVDEKGNTTVTGMKGTVMVEGPTGKVRVDAGQTFKSDTFGQDVNIDRSSSTAPLDTWSAEREEYFNTSAPPPRDSIADIPEPALAEMDRNGEWVPDPDYGWSWRPTVGSDWAPYRNGRWVHRPAWGWTWVSYEPWGHYPHHYGRWVYATAGWVWVPVHTRTHWSPGLVFWIEGPTWIGWHPWPYHMSYYHHHHVGHHHYRQHYATFVHHRHFRGGHYNRHIRPVPHNVHQARIHRSPSRFRNPVNVRGHRTPRVNGYVADARRPASSRVYAHNRSSVKGKADRAANRRVAHYGSSDRRPNRIETARTDKRDVVARRGGADRTPRPPATRSGTRETPRPGTRTDIRNGKSNYGDKDRKSADRRTASKDRATARKSSPPVRRDNTTTRSSRTVPNRSRSDYNKGRTSTRSTKGNSSRSSSGIKIVPNGRRTTPPATPPRSSASKSNTNRRPSPPTTRTSRSNPGTSRSKPSSNANRSRSSKPPSREATRSSRSSSSKPSANRSSSSRSSSSKPSYNRSSSSRSSKSSPSRSSRSSSRSRSSSSRRPR